jgi:N-acetylglucosamine-6-sulfatase
MRAPSLNRKLLIAALLASALACAALALPASGQAPALPGEPTDPSQQPSQGAGKPNFLVITTDDQTLEQMRALPKTERFIGRKGTTFRQAVVTTPHCCPSRASYLTGQYAHNHGILSNKHGYPAFVEPGNVLPAWLQEAGYTTAHLGKFLNGYEKAVGPITTVAPGWDEWATLLKPRRYLDYELQVNGESVPYGDEHADYLTNVLTKRAGRLIRDLGPGQDPFYIQLDHYAPHSGSGDLSGECGKFSGAERGPFNRYSNRQLPKTDSFNEREIEDKPVFIQRRDRFGNGAKESMRESYRCALGSLGSVDQGVKDLMQLLQEEELLEDTVVIFTSDNGFFYGEHRIPGSKTLPYEETIHVPLLIRMPSSLTGDERVREITHEVANIDLAPTILDLANAESCANGGDCRTMDGRSLVPLLQGRNNFPSDRAVVVELTQGKDTVKPTLSCSYQGIRTTREIYVEHTSVPRPSDRTCREALEVEHYDLRSDPFELENLGEDSALAARLATLRNCAGISGRDQPTSGAAFCE